jgi:hypothetical protein
MNATNQNPEMNDGLRVTQNEDKTFTLEWDPSDSRWSVLNGKTSQEISAMIQEAIQEEMKTYEK